MLDLDDFPDAVCILDPNTYTVQDTNRRFLHNISSIATGLPFVDNFIGKEDQTRFRVALEQVRADSDNSSIIPIIRDCETLTSTSRFKILERHKNLLS